MEDGSVLPRIQTGLWLYLDEPARVYETVNSLKDQKKDLDFELLFSPEAEKFRDSDEFTRLTAEVGLNAYWERFQEPDATW